eukprot:CAMPEP_0168621032 /NCGR_PEP_ID=MMETSP0449_2-20121227/7466_1 /TAXON_ID=1082188 /ORGANISM="Strombidium rassoulzadegani, Strain ras09" /LENGTH=128 /DNA_ID=CAMNT_0008662101 /DNA_START=35 /DNA_END=421 /DNA_ORIENTATION=+
MAQDYEEENQINLDEEDEGTQLNSGGGFVMSDVNREANLSSHFDDDQGDNFGGAADRQDGEAGQLALQAKYPGSLHQSGRLASPPSSRADKCTAHQAKKLINNIQGPPRTGAAPIGSKKNPFANKPPE